MARKALSTKAHAFVHEYLVDKNAARAARQAGYSAKTARSAGARLLTNVDIAAEISDGLARQADQADQADLTAERILDEIKSIAFAKVTDAYGPNGKLLNPHDMPVDVRRAIVAIEIDATFAANGKRKGEIGKITLANKLRSLELLGKHFGLFDRTSLDLQTKVVESIVNMDEVREMMKKINEDC